MTMVTREGRWISALVAACLLVLARGGPIFAQAGAGEGAAAGSGEPFQSWLVRNLIGLVILGMSFYLVALVAWMYREYRRVVAIPERLRQSIERLIEEQRETEVHGLLRREDSFLARVLREGVGRLPAGMPAAQRAMELANDKVAMEMEHRTTYLATVGTLGPMLGLLGTVYGMILSFGVIGRAGDAPQASDLAAGISTALIATLEGIAVSVPAIAFYAFFRNRISRLALDVQMEAESLLERLAPGMRVVHPLAAAVVRGSAVEPRRAALPPREESEN
jgi:biopolymer transport protein ExbB